MVLFRRSKNIEQSQTMFNTGQSPRCVLCVALAESIFTINIRCPTSVYTTLGLGPGSEACAPLDVAQDQVRRQDKTQDTRAFTGFLKYPAF